jgi:hypothetical protein
MTKIIRVVAAAAVSIAASLPALAEETKAATEAQPIPTLHCEFKTANVCSTDGTCKPGNEAAGMPLPLRVTVDFENTVVAAIDASGYARTDNIDAVVDSGGQLMIHGIDRAFAWQMVFHQASPAASISFASADTVISGFGTCSNK